MSPTTGHVNAAPGTKFCEVYDLAHDPKALP